MSSLWEPKSEELIRDSIKTARIQARAEMRERYQFAIDYLQGRQIDDVERELLNRYESTQMGQTGQEIKPQVINITERYIAEAANAYTKPVKREVLQPDGEVNTKLTDEYNGMLADCGYDERMQHVDETSLLIGSCALWHQGRKGQLRPKVTYPHDVYPVEPGDDEWFDPSSQEDYAAYLVELYGGTDDPQAKVGRRFAWVSPAQLAFYEGKDPWTPAHDLQPQRNPFMWPQVADTTNLQGVTKTLPLQPISFWHRRMPVDELLLDVDPVIALANRELNIQLSVLLDSLAHQGWAIPVFNMLNAGAAPAVMAAGPRTAFVLQTGESAQLLDAATDYTSIVAAIHNWIQMLAIACRQSPNDYSLDGTGPMSGFAKLVDSLPKIEARAERVSRLKRGEEIYAWPRNAAIGSRIGRLSTSVEDLAKHRLRVTFSDVEYPLSVDERTRAEEHDIKYNLTTPAKILAKKMGVTEELAVEIVAKNREANAASRPQVDESTLLGMGQQQPPKPGQQQKGAGLLSQKIGARTREAANGG
jgi:hypothetical protein